MLFLIQKEEKPDIDIQIIKEYIQRQKYVHSYHEILKREMDSEEVEHLYNSASGAVPVGDLNFVKFFLKKFHGIEVMNPIEIPEVLRTEEFLKRKYSIRKKEDIPEKGKWFIKYVSELKYFSYTGEIELLNIQETPFFKDGLYQVSEIIPILSEYRCFVDNDKLISINYYNGDCTIFPDTKMIKKAISMYSTDKTRPKAYTMDVCVMNEQRDTAILEIHPWTSVGLYSYLFPESLPYCYRGGYDWYLKENQLLNTFSNF